MQHYKQYRLIFNISTYPDYCLKLAVRSLLLKYFRSDSDVMGYSSLYVQGVVIASSEVLDSAYSLSKSRGKSECFSCQI